MPTEESAPIHRPEKLRDALSHADPLYVLPKDPLFADVLVPALRSSTSLAIMMGYFSSSSFAEIAPGLATFLHNTRAPLQMVVSPFLTDADFDTLTRDEAQLGLLAKRILVDDVPTEQDLSRHTLECLAWLIVQRRLVLKIAVMRGALFHPKVWLFQDAESSVALHGSTNLTKSGLVLNREQLTLSRDWSGPESTYVIDRLRAEFDDLWSGGDDDCRVLDLPEAVAKSVVETYRTDQMPNETRLQAIWDKAHGLPPHTAPRDPSQPAALTIPPHLSYESGDFAHQGEAVRAWEAAGRRGILEMATGSGKTIAAMICAARLQDDANGLIVVVSAPYRPLIEQWCDEIRQFGVDPVNLTAVGGPRARSREIGHAGRRVRSGVSRAEVLVVSNDTLCTDEFNRRLATLPADKLLVADECHNLGADSFTANPPEYFDYRIGLSATPERQYDDAGTEALRSFFGETCFTFTLEQAIGHCLTPYDYHVHFIELTATEMEEWNDLTRQIGTQAWRLEAGQDSAYLDNLLRRRRLVLETASRKIDALASLVDARNHRDLRHTLIYATDKDPQQLDAVNSLLSARRLLFHQLTQEETANRSRTNRILSSFQEGVIQILTAKRVLDEGVNIPQIRLAYLLASTTVRRQWIQRRGRLLRTCREIGKTHADIHDLVVVPPSAPVADQQLDRDARRLVRSELDRVWEFARLSRNGPSPDGPYRAVEHLQKLANDMGSA
ncbi:MAG: DEAD/DEAH box helicase [Gammaproteobacteria bacterium]|nr:DEAD/DEAH box helicase [Gammaproteobacteria bacterium]